MYNHGRIKRGWGPPVPLESQVAIGFLTNSGPIASRGMSIRHHGLYRFLKKRKNNTILKVQLVTLDNYLSRGHQPLQEKRQI